MSENFDFMKYFVEKGANNIDELLFISIQLDLFHISRYLLSIGANMDYQESGSSTIAILLEKNNFYSIIYFIFYGFSSKDLELQKFDFNKIHPKTLQLVSEFTVNGKLWSPQTNKFFPREIKKILFEFFISIKFFSLNFKIKIPRVLLFMIVDLFVSHEIRFNQKKKKRMN